MSFALLKTILGVLLLAAGLAAALSMFAQLGRAEKKASPEKLRKVHRLAGYAFAALLLANSVLGFILIGRWGDLAPLRIVFHAVFGLTLIILLALKIAFARVYKQLVKYSPGFGLAAVVLAFLLFFTAAGMEALRRASGGPAAGVKVSPSAAQTQPEPKASESGLQTSLGDSGIGSSLFGMYCASCHYNDSQASKNGPGLKGIFERDGLPASGRPATIDNVIQQLKSPLRSMPAFGFLSDLEIADLMAYLKTL